MKEYTYGKRILALLFIFLTVCFWNRSSSFTVFERVSEFIQANVFGRHTDEFVVATMNNIESEYLDSMEEKNALIDFNGEMARILNVQGYYSYMGMYITDDRYIVSISDQTTTDYEYSEVMKFKNYLDSKGIQLIYVNCPTKYTDDMLFQEEFGIESFSNRNADLFLQRLRDSGVHVIDLREELEEDGLNITDMFYRTDHHWTTRSGLWAAKKMAEGLNEYCGYSIDMTLYDENNYSYREWKECWLGEQGLKLSLRYVGLDDYTEIKPDFPTKLIFRNGEQEVPGTFDDFINEEIYNTDIDVYSAGSWHYSYFFHNVTNCNVDQGKILFLGDSYAHVVEPFLALGVNKIDILSLRGYDGSLSEYIDAGDYDTIIISYAQFMIGAHDDSASSNYEIFNFNKI